jgi:amino acid transporter
MKEEKLIRGIGRWDLTAIVINCIIGAGIFGLPSKVYGAIGVYSLGAFIACAIVVGLIVLCYSEVASRFSSTGGPYLYAKEAFGPAVAFEVGWLYWIVRIATFAANCNLFVTYAGFLWPQAASPTVRITIILAVVSLLTLVNLIGVRQSSWLTNIFTIGKLVPLILFCIIGLFFIRADNFAAGPVPNYSSFTSAVLLLIYAFVGFEVAVIPAGEAKEPKRDFPFALLVGLAAVACIYMVVQVVAIGTLPGLAASNTPLADAAGSFMGLAGATVIVIGALVSIMGNLNVSLLGGSRILFAMGEYGQLPSPLGAVDSKFKTPYISLLLNAIVILLLTIYSSFLSALAIATITRLMVYSTTCVSLPVFRRRETNESTAFRVPYGNVVAALSLLLIVWLLSNVDFTKEGLPIIAASVVGLVLYFLTQVFSKSR